MSTIAEFRAQIAAERERIRLDMAIMMAGGLSMRQRVELRRKIDESFSTIDSHMALLGALKESRPRQGRSE